MRKPQAGFTIVELLIVIVVIAVLASISVVAYSGIQSRARDSERRSEMDAIEQALELYHIDNGGYPTCTNTTYVAGGALSACFLDNIESSLVPKYLAALPRDPINTGNDRYRYAVGYKKISDTTFNSAQTDNFITGMRLETVTTVVGGWTNPAYYTYLGGSNN